MSKTIRELTEDLLAAPSACAEVKETAQNYLDAIGGENEAAAAKTFVAELEEDIMPIDGLIAFAESDMGAKVVGEEGANPTKQNTATALHVQRVKHCLRRRMKS